MATRSKLSLTSREAPPQRRTPLRRSISRIRRGGKAQANLRAAGYTPEQIDEIYLTHMHTDHVGGLTVDGRAVSDRGGAC